MFRLLKAFMLHHRRQPLSTAIWIFGVALGVSMVSGIHLANRSALQSFSQATTAITSRATHEISSASGIIDESIYGLLMTAIPGLQAAPEVRGTLPVSGREITMVGLDPLAARKLNPLFDQSLAPDTLSRFLTEPGTVAATPAALKLANGHQQLHLDNGGRDSRIRTLVILTTIAVPESSDRPVVYGDISWVQEMLQGRGKLKSILLLIDNQKTVTEVEQLLPEHLQLVKTASRTDLYTSMLDSFNLNLTALSLLSLFVGFYLVYNTVLFSLLQRRREIGILLTMGFSPTQISWALLTEITLVAIIGSLVGLLLGYGLARYSLVIINQTISDLYFFLRSQPPRITVVFLVQGLLVGVAAAWVAAFFPLLEIRHATIVSLLSRRQGEDRTFTHRRRNFLAGLGTILLSLIIAYLPSPTPYFGFAAAFGICLGSSLMVPLATERCISFLTASTMPLIKWRLAVGAVKRSLSRSAPAIAALMVALAMSMAISLMIGSFRQTVDHWFLNSIQGDFFITDSDRDYDASLLDPQLITAVRQLDHVAAINRYRNIRYQFNHRLVRLSGVDARTLQHHSSYLFTASLPGDPWERMATGDEVFISESLARKNQLTAGDTISLDGYAGRRAYTIAAVFRDYITEHGVILLDYDNLASLLNDQGINSMALFLSPGVDRKAFAATLQQQLKSLPCFVYANHELRQRIMEIFDRSFAITLSTRMIAILVAFFGIISALLAIYIENEREYGILRALGLSRGEVFSLALGHSLTLGMLAIAGAAFCGPLLAWVLIKVINLKSFGWTIDFRFDVSLYPGMAAVTALASMAAGLYPAWRIANSQPSFQMRER
ncbi:MAG: FtsX-like permease family protein [Deltaproteobacteria bacterium]|nr:FtsX-like permease family protein [Deltaproteobacteria bacterium]